MGFKGDCASISLPDLFQTLAMTQKRGVVSILEGKHRIDLYLQGNGSLRLVNTTERERLGFAEILLDQGVIARHQLKEALKQAHTRDQPLEDVLRSEGLVGEEQLWRAIRKRVEDEILSAFFLVNAAYEFVEGEPAKGVEQVSALLSRIPFDVSAVVFEAARRIDEINRFRDQFPTGTTRFSPARPLTANTLESLPPTQAAVLRLLTRERTVDDVVRESGYAPHRVLLCLRDLLDKKWIAEGKTKTEPAKPAIPVAAADKGTKVSFGALAVQLGYASLEQVQNCLDAQKKHSGHLRPKELGKVMVEQGILFPEQVNHVLKVQSQRRGYTQVGRFSLTEKLFEDRFGVAYRAIDSEDGRACLLKVFFRRYTAQPARSEALQKALHGLMRVRHPGLATIHHVGETGRMVYAAMDAPDGPSLGEFLKEGVVFDERAAVSLVLRLADALGAAAREGVLHLDLSPDKVFLKGEAEVTVYQVGVAPMLAPSGAVEGEMAIHRGPFTPPEVVDGRTDVDQRADLYSIGVLFYRLTAGKLPVWPLPEDVEDPFLGDTAVKLLNRMLAPTPEGRLASYDELMQELQQLVKPRLKSRKRLRRPVR